MKKILAISLIITLLSTNLVFANSPTHKETAKEYVMRLQARENNKISKLTSLGFSESEIYSILDNGLAVDQSLSDNELKETIQNKVKELNKRQAFNEPVMEATRSYAGDHIIYGAVPWLLAESVSTVKFHYDSVPTEFGLVCTETGNLEGFLWKIEYFEARVAEAGGFANVLYNVSDAIDAGVRFNYNMYGEKTGSSVYHEGIDFAYSSGADLYAPANAKLTDYRDYGLTYLSLYIPDEDITLVFEHLIVDKTIKGYMNKDVSGMKIGTESNQGTGDPHTHVEIHNGTHKTPYSNTGTSLDALNFSRIYNVIN